MMPWAGASVASYGVYTWSWRGHVACHVVAVVGMVMHLVGATPGEWAVRGGDEVSLRQRPLC